MENIINKIQELDNLIIHAQIELLLIRLELLTKMLGANK